MSLISPSVSIAAEIDAINRETVNFLRSQSRRAYALANTEGIQQEVMDALGLNATSALQSYALIYTALATLGSSDGVEAPDFSKWQVNQDGTVTFIPPTES